LGGGGPDGEEVRVVGVEERDVLDDRVIGAGGLTLGAGLVEPVVGPGDAGVLAGEGEGEGIVC
jgi:hypothetical protein